MTNASIECKVRQIFAEVIGPDFAPDSIPNGPGLLEHFHIDSLMILQIIVLIEQEFDLFIDDDDGIIEMLDSLDKATLYIESSLQKNRASLQ